LPGLHRGDAEGGGEVALAGAWRPQKVQDLRAPDEVELCERKDAVAVEGGLEGEVEALECLRRIEPGGLQRDGDAAGLAVGVLLGEEAVDRLDGGELAALEAAEGVVEGLEGAGHAQPDQAGADAIEQLGHDTAPPARRRPTAS